MLLQKERTVGRTPPADSLWAHEWEWLEAERRTFLARWPAFKAWKDAMEFGPLRPSELTQPSEKKEDTRG